MGVEVGPGIDSRTAFDDADIDARSGQMCGHGAACRAGADDYDVIESRWRRRLLHLPRIVTDDSR